MPTYTVVNVHYKTTKLQNYKTATVIAYQSHSIGDHISEANELFVAIITKKKSKRKLKIFKVEISEK